MLVRLATPLIALLALLLAIATPAQAQRVYSRHLLDTVEPELNFTNVPLSEAFDFIRDSSDINVVIDWKSLEAVNIDRDTPINVRLHGVRLGKALRIILDQAGAGHLLTYYVEDNVLQITTQAKADTILYTMVYPVKDLLVEPPNFQLQDVTQVLSSLNSSGGGTMLGTSGSGASSSNAFSGTSSGGQSNTDQRTQQEQGQDLVSLIMETVRPDIWRENGGTSTIRFFRGMLIVTAPLSVQEAIGGPVD